MKFAIYSIGVSRTIFPSLDIPPETYQFLIKFLYEINYFQPWASRTIFPSLGTLQKPISFSSNSFVKSTIFSCGAFRAILLDYSIIPETYYFIIKFNYEI